MTRAKTVTRRSGKTPRARTSTPPTPPVGAHSTAHPTPVTTPNSPAVGDAPTRDPGWWYIGPWSLDAYRSATGVTVVARDAFDGTVRCGWMLSGDPPVAIDASEATRRAAVGVPAAVPITGMLLAVIDGLGLDPADLLAALLDTRHVAPETLAEIAPQALTPWHCYPHSLADRLANTTDASHIRESTGAAASDLTSFRGDVARVPFLLAADAPVRHAD